MQELEERDPFRESAASRFEGSRIPPPERFGPTRPRPPALLVEQRAEQSIVREPSPSRRAEAREAPPPRMLARKRAEAAKRFVEQWSLARTHRAVVDAVAARRRLEALAAELHEVFGPEEDRVERERRQRVVRAGFAGAHLAEREQRDEALAEARGPIDERDEIGEVADAPVLFGAQREQWNGDPGATRRGVGRRTIAAHAASTRLRQSRTATPIASG